MGHVDSTQDQSREIGITGGRSRLIVFETTHPLGPVGGVGASGAGPGPVDVIALVPLEGPELLETDLSRGEIAENGVLEPAVTVDADSLHLLGVDGAADDGALIIHNAGRSCNLGGDSSQCRGRKNRPPLFSLIEQ